MYPGQTQHFVKIAGEGIKDPQTITVVNCSGF